MIFLMSSDCLGVKIKLKQPLVSCVPWSWMCSRSICKCCFESQSTHLIWNTATGRSHASGNGTRELRSGDFKENIQLIFNSFMLDEEYWWLELTSPSMNKIVNQGESTYIPMTEYGSLFCCGCCTFTVPKLTPQQTATGGMLVVSPNICALVPCIYRIFCVASLTDRLPELPELSVRADGCSLSATEDDNHSVARSKADEFLNRTCSYRQPPLHASLSGLHIHKCTAPGSCD